MGAMIKVRSAQIAALREGRERDMRDRVERWLAARPELSQTSRAAVGALATSSVQIARSLGLGDVRNIAAFALMRFTVGGSFHRHQKISAWLQDCSVDIDARFSTIAHIFPDDVWDEAASLT
jgi:hypothetical protein